MESIVFLRMFLAVLRKSIPSIPMNVPGGEEMVLASTCRLFALPTAPFGRRQGPHQALAIGPPITVFSKPSKKNDTATIY